MAKCKLDLSDWHKEWSVKKPQAVKAGVNAAFQKIAPDMEEQFKYYEQTYVYAVVNPKEYERTKELLNSTKSEVTGTKLFVYADPSKLDSNADPHPYSYHVLHGYHHWGREDFTPPRDWVDPMSQELKNHLEQGGYILLVIKDEIQKRI